MKAVKFPISIFNLYFTYNPDTGEIKRKYATNRCPAGVITKLDNMGYIHIHQGSYYAKGHQLAFLVMTGEYPNKENEVDHINGIRTDNRWINLRMANKSENQCNSKLHTNNTTGIKGLSLNKRDSLWVCQVGIKGKRVSRSFPLPDKLLAISWLETTRKALHGNFTNHGTTEVITNV